MPSTTSLILLACLTLKLTIDNFTQELFGDTVDLDPPKAALSLIEIPNTPKHMSKAHIKTTKNLSRYLELKVQQEVLNHDPKFSLGLE